MTYKPIAPHEVYDAACRAWDAQSAGSAARLLAAVDAAYVAGRAQAFRDAAEMVENAKPETPNGNFRRAMEAYQTAIAAGLRISAKLTTTEETRTDD